ncbi:condensation domain-containing protein [Actinomadura sp. 9N215]|uniref:condensation domain-containing protein n=1 Tax=Actinomadura sp. 9N215 TaxID=3375150 RepID=UPI0037B8E27A
MSRTAMSADRVRLLARLLDEKGIAPATSSISRRAAGREDVPLSFAQQRIWFFHQLQPTSTLYNIAGTARLRGRLDVDVLRRCLAEVVRRHEILRTTYRLADGHPVQVVGAAPAALDLPVADLTGLAAAERGAAERAWRQRLADRPFDLAKEIPLRAALLRTAPDEHRFLLVQDHIATDGWSLGVLLRELAALYPAFRDGRPSPLPEPPVQYADFTLWQREWLAGDVERDQLDYWRERLAGATLLELPTGRPRAARTGWDGGRVPFGLPPDLVRRLSALGNSERATLYMVLLAASAVVFSRWSGQDDVVIGSPIANRNQLDVEDLIGCFVNTLPLRLDTSADPTFRSLLRQAREVCLGAYSHQDAQFERIVEAVNPQRGAGGQTPLVRHMLGLHNAPRPVLDLPDLDIDFDDVSTGKARFELELELELTPEGGIGGRVWFATDLFDEATVERLLGCLRTVLAAAADDPGLPVERMPMLPEGERVRLIERFSGAAEAAAEAAADAAAGAAPAGPVGELAGRWTAAAPEAVAVTDARRDWTYGELAAEAADAARRLRTPGALPDRTASAPDDGRSVAAALAALEAGPAAPAAHLLAFADWARDALGLRPGEAVLRLGPPPTPETPVEAVAPLLLGGRVVLPDSGRAAEALAAERPAVLICSPSQLAALLASDPAGVRAPRHVLLGGEPPWPELLAECRRVLSGATVWSLYRCGGLPVMAGRLEPGGPGTRLVGRPIAGAVLYVLDRHAGLAPIGVTGDLYCGGTVAGSVPDPHRPGGTLVRTGERARWLADGELEIIGPAGGAARAADVRDALLALPMVERAEVAGPAAYLSLRRDETSRGDPRAAFEERYAGRSVEDDPALNPTGWTSPSTGARLTAEELREWSDATARRVLDLGPRRVLEVGCRNGALLLRLAPQCEGYCATDLSARALNHIRESKDWVAGRDDAVRLLRRAPDDFAGLEPESFDLVLVNSLAQYAPGPGYLERMITGAAAVVRRGGTVLVADVRSLPLLPALHAGAVCRAEPGMPAAELRRTVADRIDQEEELLVDPAWFTGVAGRLPGIAAVTVLARTGSREGELAGYRYDVLLRVGRRDDAEPVRWLEPPDAGSAADLLDRETADQVGVRAVADGDVRVAARAAELMSGGGAGDAGELWAEAAAEVAPALTLAALRDAAGRAGYRTVLPGPSSTGVPGLLDVVLRRPSARGAPPPTPPSPPGPLGYANDPGHPARARVAVPLLQGQLRERLPEHALPDELVVLRAWPIGPGGVVDREALPAPRSAPEAAAPGRRPPETETEKAVAGIWADVLGIDRIGADDDFFALGGHSLMAAELVERIRVEFGLDLPLGRLFDGPTVAAVAEYVTSAPIEAAPAPAIRRADRRRRASGPTGRG